ncbi:MAG: hypothetical protein JSU87_09080 [Gemmatimonadota bacterium]|nr:MAG: hypothetical protein JSU87_09080 [Gemmatimonadota bacterium]
MLAERIRERLRRERKVWRTALLLSLVFHLLLLVFSHRSAEQLTPYAAAGPASGDPVAAAGGGGMRAMLLREPVEITIPPRPEVPVIAPVEIEREDQPELSFNQIELRQPGEGQREGAETGAGLPGGEGGGDAGNAASGLRRLIPPTPRGIIMAPLDRPSSVRGRDVTVWVFINQAGAVDSVRLDPPTPSGEYNTDLIREARQWVFEPAIRAGTAVATWWSYTWKL